MIPEGMHMLIKMIGFRFRNVAILLMAPFILALAGCASGVRNNEGMAAFESVCVLKGVENYLEGYDEKWLSSLRKSSAARILSEHILVISKINALIPGCACPRLKRMVYDYELELYSYQRATPDKIVIKLREAPSRAQTLMKEAGLCRS